MTCREGEYTWIRGQWCVGEGIYLDQGPMALTRALPFWLQSKLRLLQYEEEVLNTVQRYRDEQWEKYEAEVKHMHNNIGR